MDENGLLAHLRDSFHVPPENLATDTLAYILNSSERAQLAWLRFLRQVQPELPAVTSFRTQLADGEESGILDLIGLAQDGTRPFVGEMKFDAGLTSHQPVSYLRTLINRRDPGLLLFVVPDRRANQVWSEVRWRCSSADVELSVDESAVQSMMSATRGHVRIAITTWQEVLNVLENALLGDDDPRALWDLRQLRGMCDRQERDAFTPLESRDLDSRNGRRLREFIDLVYEIAEDVLVADGTVKIDGLARAASGHYIGRYVSIAGWQCRLQVHWDLWANRRATPVWLDLNDWTASGYTPLSDALDPLANAEPPRLITIDGWRRLFPIYLKEGVGRDEVRTDMAEQVRYIAGHIKRAPRPKAEGESLNSGQ